MPLPTGLLLLFVAGIAWAAPGGGASADPAQVAAERSAVQARAEAIRRELAAAESTHAEAADALQASEQAISDTNRRLVELQHERDAGEARVADLAQQSSALSKRLLTGQAQLATLIAQQHAAGVAEPAKLLLSGRNPADVDRLLHYWRIVAGVRAQALAGLRTDRERLAALANSLRDEQRALALLAQDEARQRAALDEQRREHANTMARVAADIRKQRSTLSALQRDDARLLALLNRLSRRPAPPPRTAEPERAIRDPRPVTGFASRRSLSMPVRGELVGRFGTPRDSGASWKGWFIRCAAGAEVQAVASGQVVWADWLRGFGNLLILDHGNGYMSLYGFNDALLANVGATVREGQAIAQAGASGGAALPGVYFEIRQDGRAVDPAPWFGR